VRRLLARGDLSPSLPSMRCVGYRQMVNFLMGATEREEMIERAVIATRQLAKRQYTWLRADQDCHWLDASQDELQQAIDLILRQFPEIAVNVEGLPAR